MRSLHRAIVMFALLWWAGVCCPLSAVAGEDGKAPAPCGAKICLNIAFDESLAVQAEGLKNALALRLGTRNVAASLGGDGSAVGAWQVHLTRAADGAILLSVASPESVHAGDFVRKLEGGEDSATTVWTLVLMIEEVLSVYLDDQPQAPVGVGLSVIEPPEVGGSLAPESKANSEEQDVFDGITVGLTLTYAADTGQALAGPSVAAVGRLSRLLIGWFGIGWTGTGQYETQGVSGSFSYLPLNLMLGVRLGPGEAFNLVIGGGFQVGFGIYRSGSAGTQRTDVLFDPRFQTLLAFYFKLVGAVSLYAGAGLTVVIVRDELKSGGELIFRQERLFPMFDFGIRIRMGSG